jgi:hypothetical protein
MDDAERAGWREHSEPFTRADANRSNHRALTSVVTFLSMEEHAGAIADVQRVNCIVRRELAGNSAAPTTAAC